MLRNMFSAIAPASSAALSKTDTAGWKWEVNHDGAVLAYQGFPSSSSSPSGSSSAPSAPEAPKGRKEHVPRTSLVDYWYLVHDGVVIPTVNDH